jgi:hypothetical protein
MASTPHRAPARNTTRRGPCPRPRPDLPLHHRVFSSPTLALTTAAVVRSFLETLANARSCPRHCPPRPRCPHPRRVMPASELMPRRNSPRPHPATCREMQVLNPTHISFLRLLPQPHCNGVHLLPLPPQRPLPPGLPPLGARGVKTALASDQEGLPASSLSPGGERLIAAESTSFICLLNAHSHLGRLL